MNKIIRLALVLFAVSAIVAGVLGVVNALTAPVIAENNEKALNESLSKFYGDGNTCTDGNSRTDGSTGADRNTGTDSRTRRKYGGNRHADGRNGIRKSDETDKADKTDVEKHSVGIKEHCFQSRDFKTFKVRVYGRRVLLE
jgi:hypothetical protein